MPFRAENLRFMLEHPCRARPAEFAAVMETWGTQLSKDREKLIIEVSSPSQILRPDAPYSCMLFLIGTATFFEIEAVVAPGGSTLEVWSLPSMWSEVEKLWQFVLAELVRRRWCEPQTKASDEPAEGGLSGFEKKNARVHSRYLETAKYYVGSHFDVEQTKRWYSGRFPQFKGGRSTFERMLTYAVAYDRWLKEGSQNVK